MLKTLKTLKDVFFLGIAAGTLIGIGGAVYLACSASGTEIGKYVGAVLFTVALLTICVTGMYLYTGKICYIIENRKPEDVLSLFAGLLGNYIGALFTGLMTSVANPTILARAQALTAQKLDMKWYNVIIAAFFCDILIFAAVHIYKTKGSVIGIMIAIPTFILCSFEHSIADMYYVSAARSFSFETVGFILLVILGNTLGGLFIPVIFRLGGKKCDEKG